MNLHHSLGEAIIDEQTTQLIIEKSENCVAFTLNNVGDVDLKYGANLVIFAGTSKVISGNNNIPFAISRPVSFAKEQAGYKMVVVEKIFLVQE